MSKTNWSISIILNKFFPFQLSVFYIFAVALLILGGCHGKRSEKSSGVSQLTCTDSNAINYDPQAKEKKQDCVFPVQKQSALLIYFTSTGCPVCGNFGNNTFHKINRKYKDLVVPVAIHKGFGDPLVTDASEPFFRQLFPSSAPCFFVGTQNPMVYDEDFIEKEQTYTAITNHIDSVTGQDPLLEMAIALTTSKNNGMAYFGARFTRQTTGIYQYSLYLLENKLVTSQKGKSGVQQHDHVFRKSLTPVFGKKMVTGKVEKGHFFRNNVHLKINESWKKQDLALVGVVWEKTSDTTYRAVNAARSKNTHKKTRKNK